jgi:pilus assembly protein Flp/PilA
LLRNGHGVHALSDLRHPGLLPIPRGTNAPTIDQDRTADSWPRGNSGTAAHKKESTVKQLVMKARVRMALAQDKGATAVEYGLLVALIAAIIIGVVATLGTEIQGAFQSVVDALP